MTSYTFTTSWLAYAPIDRVFDAIAAVEEWPAWWRGVESASITGTEGPDGNGTGGVGSRYRFRFRGRLPYSLAFEMLVTALDRPRRLVGQASGELEGTGTWLLRPADGGSTHVTYEWNVRTTRWWMNLVGPLARPLFAANHDIIMGWGRTGLARHLGARVEAAQASSESGSSRGAPTGA